MTEPTRRHFITDIIDADLAAGRNGGAVVTRFPPEPNGFLHIGHAKSICLNFGLAQRYGGRCHLRFDDTNPLKEETRYVESIQADVRWLGFDWGEHLYFGSDYFDRMIEVAEHLIDRGLAYVDDQTVEAIREGRGGFDRPGTNSPYRDRSVAENRDFFARMQQGEFEDGSRVLRARIDMAHPNMIMRDPLLYRIRHAHHHRTGDRFCVYPMYDFAHCLEDAFEGITHSICTLEFESNRELYDWVLDAVDDLYGWAPRPRQYEFARLQVGYTVMSKRKFLRLVEEGHVEGWDDPRMPTIAGMRRRGYTPEAIRNFAELVGIAKNNSFVDIGKLEHCVRSDLEERCPRALAVQDPVPLVLEGLPEGYRETLELAWWPGDPERAGSREVPISANLLVERDDFADPAPNGWKRMTTGGHVRLFGAFVVRIDAAERDAEGRLLRLRGRALPETIGGANPGDGSRVAGAIHWLDADTALPAEVRLYDRLVRVEMPEAGGADFLESLNPDSLQICADARVEAGLRDAPAGHRVQFLRLGYFCADPDAGAEGKPRWNRIITLRDTWAKATGAVADDGRPQRARAEAGPQQSAEEAAAARAASRTAAHAADAALAHRYGVVIGAGLGEEDADVLAADADLFDLWQAGVVAFLAAGAPGNGAEAVGRWARNELKGALAGAAIEDADGTGARLGRLVALVAADSITAAAGKRVLAEMLASGREPSMLVEELGLLRKGDDAVAAAVAAVLEANPTEVERFRAGEKKLTGFFIGQAMGRLKGAADAGAVRSAVLAALG